MISKILGKLLAEKSYVITKIKEEPEKRPYWTRVLTEINRYLDPCPAPKSKIYLPY